MQTKSKLRLEKLERLAGERAESGQSIKYVILRLRYRPEDWGPGLDAQRAQALTDLGEFSAMTSAARRSQHQTIPGMFSVPYRIGDESDE